MGTVRYTTVNGEVIAEKRGGVRRHYVPDPLGSTVALLDSGQTKTDTFAYWPYGEEASRTGTTPTPLRFGGTMGYYRDNATRSYVRARHLDIRAGRWTTQDPLWPYMAAYLYADCSPLVFIDSSGYKPRFPLPFYDCFYPRLAKGISVHAACLQCGGADKCRDIPVTRLPPDIRVGFGKLIDRINFTCCGDNVEQCCIGIANDIGSLLGLAGAAGGTILPSQKFQDCVLACTEAVNKTTGSNHADPVSLGAAFAGFSACAGKNPNKPSHWDLIQLLLDIINAVTRGLT